MAHPNDMTHWPRIACERGHEKHRDRWVTIDLGKPHGYGDLPAVPAEWARTFEMAVWDPDEHPVDSVGIYCPAHDAVSETIVSHRIWEPRESLLTLALLTSGAPHQRYGDFGCQIGWFSLLAASCGVRVDAFDAELENLGLLARSRDANNWGGLIKERFGRIGPDTPPLPPTAYRLVKIDVEGAERDVIRILQPSINAGLVDYLLVEISPVFKPGDHYAILVQGLVAQGYEAYLLPGKSRPPREFTDPASYLAPYRLDTHPTLRDEVMSFHQEDMLFRRIGASW